MIDGELSKNKKNWRKVRLNQESAVSLPIKWLLVSIKKLRDSWLKRTTSINRIKEKGKRPINVIER